VYRGRVVKDVEKDVEKDEKLKMQKERGDKGISEKNLN
jgi:hypothetical protein